MIRLSVVPRAHTYTVVHNSYVRPLSSTVLSWCADTLKENKDEDGARVNNDGLDAGIDRNALAIGRHGLGKRRWFGTTTKKKGQARVELTIDVKPRLDFKGLIENADKMKREIVERRIDMDPEVVDDVCRLYQARVEMEQKLIMMRSERNTLAAQNKKRKPTPEDIAAGRELKLDIAELEEREAGILKQLDTLALSLPNFGEEGRPIPTPEQIENNEEGVVVATGTKRGVPVFDFPVKDHLELGKDLDLLDFEAGALTTGTKFVFYKNEAALMELALGQWILAKLFQRGFTPLLTPDLARTSILEGCGFQPRGSSSHVYRVETDSVGHEGNELCLIGTSEITVGGSMANHYLHAEDLPKKFVAFSHCFRAEAGASGTASKGLYRVHQFSKAEMFIFCQPNESKGHLQELLGIQQEICDELGLHWRTIDMFPHELGNPASRKYDVQVFMPSRGDFGEVASISNCTDYQSRRLNIRFRNDELKEKGFCHTLNGTAIAIPRIILSIMEYYQQADGSIVIPECLQPFMQTDRIIKKKE